MVLAFSKAEIDTPNWKKYAMPILSDMGYTRTLIDDADLGNESENRARVYCLSCMRGFKKNQLLFESFPAKVRWNKVYLSIDELGGVKYINQQDPWVKLSGDTRLVSGGANNRNPVYPINSDINSIEEKVRAGFEFPELVLVSEREQSDFILLEGHKRATAYVRAGDYLTKGINVIAGFSEELNNWKWY